MPLLTTMYVVGLAMMVVGFTIAFGYAIAMGISGAVLALCTCLDGLAYV